MIIHAKSLAQSITDELSKKILGFSRPPCLTIIKVGNDSASEVYVRNKIKTCESIGILGKLINLDKACDFHTIKNTIETLNQDDGVDGILVQSPLPDHITAQEVFDCIDPRKDVDGFCATNMAHLYSGNIDGLVPGTPKGIMRIIDDYLSQRDQSTIIGKDVVVIGKSTIVGKPLTMLLLQAGATVTLCHSRTKNLTQHTKEADIIISAVGKQHLITKDMIRPGSLTIDVGINVVEASEKRKITGDCDTEEIATIADITPVPGGVGPMTIAMLLSNVVKAYEERVVK